MSHPCQYCETEFQQKRDLNRHQKTAKYCVAIQKEQGLPTPEPSHKCKCGESFSLKQHLRRHHKTCASSKVVNIVPIVEISAPLEPANELESVVKERLVKSLVQTEVRLPNGIVDVVTHDQIIEIKKASLWKHALGQILAYGFEPECQGKTKRIHLFGSVKDKTKIAACCAHYGVLVSFDDQS